jgi:hypothetical protein
MLLEHFESAPKSSVAMIVKPAKNKYADTDLAAFSAAHPEQPSQQPNFSFS